MNTIRLFAIVVAFVSFSTPVTAASVAPGELIITEVMANPGLVSDTAGEWFELHNLTGNSLDINGLTISDGGSNLHVIDNGGSLIIDPAGYLVLGRNGVSTLNGGYTADYVYDDFVLSNSKDEIIISSSDTEIVRLKYTSGFAVGGVSQELSGTVGLSLDNSNFVSSIIPYGDGDLGTPGEAGNSNWSLEGQSVPVPPAIWLFGSAIIGFMGMRKRPALGRPEQQLIASVDQL
jgi:hypothetical protein